MKRSKLLTVIIIFTILSGLWSVTRSFPFFSLYNSIKQGGITSDIVRIKEVQPNTPASEAGLRENDVIVSIDNKPITSFTELTIASETNQGKEVVIVVERDGNTHPVKITPRDNPKPGTGRLGVVISNPEIIKTSPLTLIPMVIGRSYLGREEISFNTFGFQQYYLNHTFSRLKSLFLGSFTVMVGVGLWKWKQWALYGYLLITGYRLLVTCLYVIISLTYNIRPLPSSMKVIIGSLIIEVVIAYYIFKQKKLFQRNGK